MDGHIDIKIDEWVDDPCPLWEETERWIDGWVDIDGWMDR